MNSTQADDRDLTAVLFAVGALPEDDSKTMVEKLLCGDQAVLEAMAPWLPVVAALAEIDPPLAPRPELRAKLFDRIGQHQELAPVLERIAETAWEKTLFAGVWRRLLYRADSGNRTTMMIRLDPGAEFPPHVHDCVEEVFLLEGDLSLEQTELKPGDYQRFAAGTCHGVQRSTHGCIAIIITSVV